MALCQFCRKKIDEDKIMLHEMYCERNCIKCTRCGLMYDQNDPESHEEEFHKLQQCPHCKLEFQDLNKHSCQEAPIICIYCQLGIPQRQFTAHEMQCGSRTEKCESCKQYVKMSDFQIHQEICVQKKFDKLGRGEILDDFPSLEEVKQAIVPLNFDEQYKRQTQQKQAYPKQQTQQPIEHSYVPVKSQKIEYPNDQQYGMLDRRGDQSKNVPTNQLKDGNYYNYNYNYNNSSNPIPDNSRNKETYALAPKQNQEIKNTQGLRSTYQTQEIKQQSDRIQNSDQQIGNRQHNIPKYDEKYERDKKYIQDNQIQTRLTQQINNTQEVTSSNDQKSYQYSNNIKQPSNNPNQNQKYSTQSQNPQKYQQERGSQDNLDSRFPHTQDRSNYDMYSKNVSGQKYGTTQTQQITKTYQPTQQMDQVLYSNQTNKYPSSSLEQNKFLNRQTKQERPEIGLNSRDQRQTNNQRAPVVQKPLDIQERKEDKRTFGPTQNPQYQQTNQFYYQRNPDAHQEATYSNPSSYPKQTEYQRKYNEVSQKSTYDSKPQDYQQQRELKTKPIEAKYEFGKIFDDKPENYPPSQDSIIAKTLQESIYADDLQMTQSQIMEQKLIYQLLEENAKKQGSGQNKPYQQEQRIDRNAQTILPNEFDYLTEEEKLFQKQLLESIEYQKKRW
ncbi:unnamed protein product (macronuclear) [Paramecium tetraurelia]|uniref:TRAFD1/XAF1 zinc finger domain-containing protein n=1 Tax=Paramecium tetraurelia TaxID=5888 RepID=A0CUJ1_PARTE|nr:uncharacterized protein GSPATT00010658001 [Paramecium tetraurelia]CAK74458.1 unnamed protein product [Paramecium tetraurelia]|eukprot:XP_001441855.1 hypothetical protein (macronuclear) [Paramecium tetraurelia strain d4-2]